jgi:hypothetical protein
MIYWPLNLNDLPSKGRFYQSYTEIFIRPLSFGDMKFLSTLNVTNCVTYINMVLSNCLKLNNINFNDILEVDRKFMVLWIRANSFLNLTGYATSGYSTSFVCPYCNTHNEKKIQLDDLNIKYFDPSKEDTYKDYHTKLKSIGDLAVHYSDTDDNLISNFIEQNKGPVFLPELKNSAMDYAKVLSMAKKFECGVDSIVQIQCKCGKVFSVDLALNDDNMFQKPILKDLLDKQIEITKYSGIQINDDTSYTDLEILSVLVNEKIKAENEKNDASTVSLNNNIESLKSKINGLGH